ncbi:MAG: ATP-binding protein [Bacteroidales bacterium]|nr:ATP-binding protein [Bacteroidales bacterium]
MKNADKTKKELLKELQELKQKNSSLKELPADISKIKKVEEDLRASEIRYRRLFESAKDGIIILDADTGKIVDVNPFLIDLLGYSYEQFVEKAIWEIGAFKDIISNYDKFLELQQKEYVRYHDLPLATYTGHIIHVEFVSNVYQANGKNVIQCNIRDISERIEIEKELIKAKEKAENSDRLKSVFLTNMSHEIRTPMNGILGFTELLKEPTLKNEDIQDYIEIIQISGKRMLNTINNIVDISKIESGLIQVNYYDTDMNEKMDFIYHFFKSEVEYKGLEFSMNNNLSPKESIIKTDNEKVYGILSNLIKNAIKFTDEGSIKFGYNKKGEFLEFFVQDTGPGIPEIQKELIFERFRQGSESLSRAYEGSGLGLSIAKSYVEMLGGKIWLESQEGKGTTFYFTIPYLDASNEKTKITNADPTGVDQTQLKNLKVLIVEDDEISYSLLKRMIQNISKEILYAMTGAEAIEICRNNPDLDLVLMDIRMPVMDGSEATRTIRQFNKDVIIIAQSAYAFSRDKETAIKAGCNDHIPKPINRNRLYELIEKHCKKTSNE